MSRYKVVKLMKEAGAWVRSKKKYKVTTNSNHNQPVFGYLKQERVQWKNYQTRFEAQQDILNYITMFYNSHRLNSYPGYKSPNDYESEMMKFVVA